jgi:excisionase family DNA binding protein
MKVQRKDSNSEMIVKNKKEFTTWESLPDTLTAAQISQYLRISRRRVYELFQISVEHGGIQSFEIGASKRVDKADFKLWIDQRKKEKRTHL